MDEFLFSDMRYIDVPALVSFCGEALPDVAYNFWRRNGEICPRRHDGAGGRGCGSACGSVLIPGGRRAAWSGE
jgi:hypothetical protein